MGDPDWPTGLSQTNNQVTTESNMHQGTFWSIPETDQPTRSNRD